MESETTTPPAKRLCTESAAVIKQTEASSVEKLSELKSAPEPANDKLVVKQKEPENKTVDPEKEIAPKNGAAHETVTEVPAELSEEKNSQSQTAKQQPATIKPPEKGEKKIGENNAKPNTGKGILTPKRSSKQNGYEASKTNNRLPSTPIDQVDLSRVIEDIQVCDFEIEEMTISANQKVVEIERALRESKKPVYCKRSDLIQHIPEFWLTTLINHHHISHFINEADEDCLQYLKKLHVEEFDDSVSGFKISFVFEANPYFENEVLCKEISYGVSGVLRSKATPIRWKPGHDLTRVTEASASSSKIMPQSFFHWFLQNSNPVQDKVAVFIRDDIWPNPLKYFQVHTEDSTIDVSSDGIIVDSSGEEDESVLVLEEDRSEDFEDLDDEDIELLENEDEMLDEEFDSEEEDLLMEDDEDFDDDELMLIESQGIPPKQKSPVKKTAPPPRVPASLPNSKAPAKGLPSKATPVVSKAPSSTTNAMCPTSKDSPATAKAPKETPVSKDKIAESAPVEQSTKEKDSATQNSINQKPVEGESALSSDSGEAKKDPVSADQENTSGQDNPDKTDSTAEEAGREKDPAAETVAESDKEKNTEPSSTEAVKS